MCMDDQGEEPKQWIGGEKGIRAASREACGARVARRKGVPTAKCIRAIGFAWVLYGAGRPGKCHLTILLVS